IGGTTEPAQLPASKQEADESLALRAARRRPGGSDGAGGSGVASAVVYDESWDEILIQRLRAAAASGRAPTRGPVADLTRYDAERGTQYIATLRAWLEA